MAVSADVLRLMQAYAFYYDTASHGSTPAQARAHASERLAVQFPWATPQQRSAAANQFNLGMATAAAIEALPGTAPLSSALGSSGPPGSTVGVRILITYTTAAGVETYKTIYLNMPWTDRKDEIQEQAIAWLDERGGRYGHVTFGGYELIGPSRLPIDTST